MHTQARLHIAGAGCAVLDYLYTKLDFESPVFRNYLSRRAGDGGLSIGRLVFDDELERFAGKPFAAILTDLVGGRPPDTFNLGGPSVVALAHAAQLLYDQDCRVSFHGLRGDDAASGRIGDIVRGLPLDCGAYRSMPGTTSTTWVFSDPGHGGMGERSFVNALGVARDFKPDTIDRDLFSADIVEFGGTALVPPLNAALDGLLARARAGGAVTVVNTVYDFLAEKRDPGGRWLLGRDERTYGLIDLLVVDHDEALRLSGGSTAGQALAYFLTQGTGACVITHGAEPLRLYSAGGLFLPLAETQLPVSEALREDIRAGRARGGDTTGCGDNFVGGLLAAMGRAFLDGKRDGLDLLEAAEWGVVSGGFCCFHPGGLFHQSRPGEKLARILPYLESYRQQLGRQTRIRRPP
jgi:sugar/nucleoside kinase (ribokinase family)